MRHFARTEITSSSLMMGEYLTMFDATILTVQLRSKKFKTGTRYVICLFGWPFERFEAIEIAASLRDSAAKEREAAQEQANSLLVERQDEREPPKKVCLFDPHAGGIISGSAFEADRDPSGVFLRPLRLTYRSGVSTTNRPSAGR